METVGDKYMAVSGLPEPSISHAKNIAKLALDMMDLGSSVIFDGSPVVTNYFETLFWPLQTKFNTMSFLF